jgi:hypothetical protein
MRYLSEPITRSYTGKPETSHGEQGHIRRRVFVPHILFSDQWS